MSEHVFFKNHQGSEFAKQTAVLEEKVAKVLARAWTTEFENWAVRLSCKIGEDWGTGVDGNSLAWRLSFGPQLRGPRPPTLITLIV